MVIDDDVLCILWRFYGNDDDVLPKLFDACEDTMYVLCGCESRHTSQGGGVKTDIIIKVKAKRWIRLLYGTRPQIL